MKVREQAFDGQIKGNPKERGKNGNPNEKGKCNGLMTLGCRGTENLMRARSCPSCISSGDLTIEKHSLRLLMFAFQEHGLWGQADPESDLRTRQKV